MGIIVETKLLLYAILPPQKHIFILHSAPYMSQSYLAYIGQTNTVNISMYCNYGYGQGQIISANVDYYNSSLLHVVFYSAYACAIRMVLLLFFFSNVL